jgi:acyl-CoA dehydrogenase
MSDEILGALGELLESMPVHQPSGLWSEEAERTVLQRLTDEGWTKVGLAESLGGSGGGIRDAAAVVTACAASGHLLPLAELTLSSARLLELGAVELPERADCVLPIPGSGTSDSAGRVSARTTRVAWARWASHFLVLTETDSKGTEDGCTLHVIDATAAEVDIRAGVNLAGEPRDAVVMTDATPVVSVAIPRPLHQVVDQQRLAGALARSVQMAAGINGVLTMTARYTLERRQFGRQLRAFQAVQQELAALAAEAAAADGAVESALDAILDDGADLAVAPVATAKVRTGMAAGAAARSGHQLHGALGITLEYGLHRFTRSLWSWREEYGNETEWATRLTGEVIAHGAHDPWSWLTST